MFKFIFLRDYNLSTERNHFPKKPDLLKLYLYIKSENKR